MTVKNFKQAADCSNMRDVRQAIDALDEQLLDLLAQRIEYIKRAAQIKTSIETIRDESRISSIIDRRKSQAAEHGYSEQFIASLFRDLIEYSVDFEMQLWKKNKSQTMT